MSTRSTVPHHPFTVASFSLTRCRPDIFTRRPFRPQQVHGSGAALYSFLADISRHARLSGAKTNIPAMMISGRAKKKAEHRQDDRTDNREQQAEGENHDADQPT
jgi:hypothetical protein